MSERSSSPSSIPHEDARHALSAKRKATQAGLDGHAPVRSVKRRASKACQCCRSRKVRCNVTEHGAPCTNCRLDQVECIVSESRRKKNSPKDDQDRAESASPVFSSGLNRKLVSRGQDNHAAASGAPRPGSHESEGYQDEHVPHSIYQQHGDHLQSLPNFADWPRPVSIHTGANGLASIPFVPLGYERSLNFGHGMQRTCLPPHIKPLPARMGSDELFYLQKKGTLNMPTGTLRAELLRAYVEFVHPYMPLLDLHEFLLAVDQEDGSNGQVSLILFQAVMFAGSAFVDMSYLRAAGYTTRKEARKDFFTKTRILYDFDYESDRVSLVQALLLLTYYYETPDDQKDTWHWMGVATSVAYTIGLHRNPDTSRMDAKRIKLWKRIWWSTYMRDRLIALGMRRPTRIKPEDFDVPMLTLDDFEIAPLPNSISCVPLDCRTVRHVSFQRQLAIMCIEKAKLCLCISGVLSKQYCVLNNNQGVETDRTTMMLLPKKLDLEASDVKACDETLQTWVQELPEDAQYKDEYSGESALDVNRALLHMIFFTTLSALHRPQVLPSTYGGAANANVKPNISSELLEISRRNVRRAASAITSIAQRLDALDLVRYLPTTGVTVLLPAIIIHLLDIKAPDEETRQASARGFAQCMAVMGKMRELYAAADYSTAFLEAAIRKAGIDIAPAVNASSVLQSTLLPNDDQGLSIPLVNNTIPTSQRHPSALTPPPDRGTTNMYLLEKKSSINSQIDVSDAEVARRLETFLASTPPGSDHDHQESASHTHTDSHVPSFSSLAAAADDDDNDDNDDDNNPSAAVVATAANLATMPWNKYSTFMTSNPQAFGSANLHHDDEMLFSSLPMNHEFDDGDFDSLLNLDAVGEAFCFEGEGGAGAAEVEGAA